MNKIIRRTLVATTPIAALFLGACKTGASWLRAARGWPFRHPGYSDAEMKMKTPTIALAFALCAGMALTGCRHGYVNPASMNFDERKHETLYDLKTCVADLVQKMQNDEGFREAYDLKEAKKGSLPVLQIGNIENMTSERVATQKLESARRRLEIALRKTRLFDITDDAASAESDSETLANSLVKNVDVGLKGDDNLQHFGQHVSADYQIYGRYRKFHDGDRYTYELSLRLIDIATGKFVWSDLSEVAKE